MGGALLKGWGKSGGFVISVLDPHSPDADYASVHDIPAATPFDVIVLAVKPQVMSDIVTEIKPVISPTSLVLSIAAGKPVTFFENLLGNTQPVIRAMPNTPALVGEGMTVLCSNAAVTHSHRQIATEMMSSVGLVEWIADESLMNAVTAVSGSGPAYVFYLIESLTDAGIAAGLPHLLARQLARQTVIGAAALARTESSTPASTLRQNVTSPGGTTEAALNVLMDPANGLSPLMTHAIRAAKTRGEQLQ